MLSLKEIAEKCLSQKKPLSVNWDILGCWTKPGRLISLKRQLELLKGPGLNINIILVGAENFTDKHIQNIDEGIQVLREIYAKVDLCIRKIRWCEISVKDAGTYVNLDDSPKEAHDLTNDWNGPNGDYLDVFIVVNSTVGGYLGLSETYGPCSKDSKDQMTGCVIALLRTGFNTGICLAHEIGHYLGASKDEQGFHNPDPHNFMCSGYGGIEPTDITVSQGNEMKSHCYVKKVCF